MTKLFISLILLSLCGCATRDLNATLFLKEDDSRFYNLQGDDCLISGYDIKKNLEGETYRMVTYFSNCDIHEERTLKEFELPHWGIKKPQGMEMR